MRDATRLAPLPFPADFNNSPSPESVADETLHGDLALETKLKIAVERQIETSLTQHHEALLSQIRYLVDGLGQKDAPPKVTQHIDTIPEGLFFIGTEQEHEKRNGRGTIELGISKSRSTAGRGSIEPVRPHSPSRHADRGSSASARSSRQTDAGGPPKTKGIRFLTKSMSNVVTILEKTQHSRQEQVFEYISQHCDTRSNSSLMMTLSSRSLTSQALEQVESRAASKTRLQSFLLSPLFDLSMGFLVCSNAVFVGCEVNYLATHPHEVAVPMYFQVISYCYTCAFLVELILRLISDCYGFLCEVDLKQLVWNYLDIFIVVSSLVEIGVEVAATRTGGASGGVSMSNVQTIRVIRVFRLLRLIRIARFVRFIRSLRLMIYSIFHTLTHVFWAMILLAVIMYIFAILFTSATTSYKTTILINEDAPFIPNLVERWGTIDTSMLSLFMSIASGISWGEVLEPLNSLNTIWTYLFLLYLSFTYFAVLNVVTGVFCQAAQQSSNEDQDAMLQAFVRHQRIYTERFIDLFKNIDADETGYITIEEFVDHMYEEDVSSYFASLGLESVDALCIFDLLEDAGEGVKVEEFVMGCLRLKGYARSSDMLKLLHEHRLLSDQIKKLIDHFQLDDTISSRMTVARGVLKNDLLGAQQQNSNPGTHETRMTQMQV